MSVGTANNGSSTQVITLKPGEQFSLPPNAEITYVSDIASFESECLFDLNWTERCYRFAYENNNNAPVSDATIISYIIDGTEMPLDNPVSYVVAGLETELTNSIPLGLFTFVMTCNSGANPRIVFKSIGKEIYLRVSNPTGHESVGGGETFFLVPAEQIVPCDCSGALGDDSDLSA